MRPATNDVSTVPAPHGSTHANQMVSRGSADHGSQMTEHQRFRENTSSFYSQTAPFQATTAITPGHGNHKASGGMQSQWREQNLRGTPFIQAPGYPQPSPMQNHLASMGMRDPPPSTLTTSSGVWGSIGGTFSSVSSSDQDGFRRVPDASQSSNLPHPLSQLQITGDNNAGGFGGNMQPSRSSYDVHGYMNGPYGQVPATPQQDQYSHYHTCTQYVIDPTTLKISLSNMFKVPTVTPVTHKLIIHHMETMPPPLERFELYIAQYMAAAGAQAVTDHSPGLAIF